VRLVLQPPAHALARWPGGFGARELGEIAVAAEEVGFDAISVTDHPFPSDDWLAIGGHHALDPFVALTFAGARTSRIRLLTNLVVAGYRNPFVTAKAAASVDVLSGGRLTLGLGAGYLEAEFAALGADATGRGPLFDAALTAMRAAWTGESVTLGGPFPAAGHTALPAPLQHPHPPVWIGGNSRRARRRAAEHGQGWMPFQQPPEQAAVTGTDTLATIDELADRIGELDGLRRAAGRTEPLDVCFAPAGIGRAERLLAFLDESGAACAQAGVTWIAWTCSARSLDACLAEIGEAGAAVPVPDRTRGAPS
jgi:probable F420-dependent oxidoreductase